ncbi:MAG: hypothetical protein CL878_03860, partial [Dehalococcoidia bacterium]|nr:hypothetical protein [Dehalococcoidia bacterium]
MMRTRDKAPPGWTVLREARDDGPRWTVYPPDRPRPVAWGLRSPAAAIRWAWRLARGRTTVRRPA